MNGLDSQRNSVNTNVLLNSLLQGTPNQNHHFNQQQQGLNMNMSLQQSNSQTLSGLTGGANPNSLSSMPQRPGGLSTNSTGMTGENLDSILKLAMQRQQSSSNHQTIGGLSN